MPQPLSQIFLIVGRMALASLFVLGAINKIMNYQHTLLMMDDAGIPLSFAALPIVIMLELLGGLIIAMNHRFAPIAALTLAVYTICVNAVFHRFWTMEDPLRALELSLFFKNISIAGGLLMIASGALAHRQHSRGNKA